MSRFDEVVAAINEHPMAVARTLASLIVNLGSKEEWSMEDNFYTTEAIAALAEGIGLPQVGDPDEAALRFYREARRDR